MDREGCSGRLIYYANLVILPIVVYILKNKYTTIELFGSQFDTMVTIFPLYFIISLISIYLFNIKKPPRNDS